MNLACAAMTARAASTLAGAVSRNRGAASRGVMSPSCAGGGSEHTAGQARYLPDGRLTPRGLMKGATSKAQMQMSWVDEDPLDHFLPRSVTKLTLLYHKLRDLSSGLRARAARMEVRCLSRSGVGRIRTARRVSPISP